MLNDRRYEDYYDDYYYNDYSHAFGVNDYDSQFRDSSTKATIKFKKKQYPLQFDEFIFN